MYSFKDSGDLLKTKLLHVNIITEDGDHRFLWCVRSQMVEAFQNTEYLILNSFNITTTFR